MHNARIYNTKTIRPLSTTKSGGKIISPTKELLRLKEGQYLVVDDASSRHHMLTAAARLDVPIQTRKCDTGYEIHRIAKPVTAAYDFPI